MGQAFVALNRAEDASLFRHQMGAHLQDLFLAKDDIAKIERDRGAAQVLGSLHLKMQVGRGRATRIATAANLHAAVMPSPTLTLMLFGWRCAYTVKSACHGR